MNSAPETNEDDYLSRLKKSVELDSVVKYKIANLRSSLPEAPIFAFEGDDDKIIYARWIDRIRPSLDYEPYICEGKKEVIRLKKVLSRDKSGLEIGIYFFVDRDFDGVSGFPDTKSVFVTDRYSVENYLVDEQVLERVLRDEFPCHGEPKVRSKILTMFTNDYNNFLMITMEFNLRLFVVRRTISEFDKKLPQRVGHYAQVAVGNVTAPVENPCRVFEDKILPSKDMTTAFEALVPRFHYRGKLALLFFRSWLRSLEAELRATKIGLFDEIDPEAVVRSAELTLGGVRYEVRVTERASRLPLGRACSIGAMGRRQAQ